MKIGYARTSTEAQKLDLQIDALIDAGCEPDSIYSEKISGKKTERPELQACLKALRKGDQLVVWRLDRLGRSFAHLIQTVNELKDRGVGFVSIKENIDTTTPAGELVFHVFASLSQFETELNRERVLAGLEAAKKRGKTGGRKRALNERQVEQAMTLLRSGNHTPKDIAAQFGCTSRTLYNVAKRYEQERQRCS